MGAVRAEGGKSGLTAYCQEGIPVKKAWKWILQHMWWTGLIHQWKHPPSGSTEKKESAKAEMQSESMSTLRPHLPEKEP